MATYTVSLTPINAIPSTGSIQIGWPSQISVTDFFACQVRTNRLFTDQSNCSVDFDSRTITITGVFTEIQGGWANTVSIDLVGMRNPLNNNSGSGFIVQTYEDSEQIYSMDVLEGADLAPIIDCPDPFVRLKNQVTTGEYDGLCHIVLELETYMLEQKELPTDFSTLSGTLNDLSRSKGGLGIS